MGLPVGRLRPPYRPTEYRRRRRGSSGSSSFGIVVIDNVRVLVVLVVVVGRTKASEEQQEGGRGGKGNPVPTRTIPRRRNPTLIFLRGRRGFFLVTNVMVKTDDDRRRFDCRYFYLVCFCNRCFCICLVLVVFDIVPFWLSPFGYCC
jgi:hypothetical protein